MSRQPHPITYELAKSSLDWCIKHREPESRISFYRTLIGKYERGEMKAPYTRDSRLRASGGCAKRKST